MERKRVFVVVETVDQRRIARIVWRIAQFAQRLQQNSQFGSRKGRQLRLRA